MLKVCRFNPIPGVRVYIYFLLQIFVINRTAIDFYRNCLTFNFYGQLKHDIRSLRYVSRCFVFQLLFEKLLEKKPRNPKTG